MPVRNEFGIQLTNKNHYNLVSEIAKALYNNKLKITLSNLDPLYDIESLIPITLDLDMIVVFPFKKFL